MEKSARQVPASTEATSAPAQAVPASGRRAATDNPLYKTGQLADSHCQPGDLPPGSTEAYRRFLTRMTDCLNASWNAQFKKAGLRCSKPRLRIITKKVRTACGAWATGADGLYCSGDRTMYMLISKDQLRQPFPLGIARLMAHEYGHHVQQASGIWNYYWAARGRASGAAALQLSRRSELQAECFSSVFMSTIADDAPFGSEQSDGVVDAQQGDSRVASPVDTQQWDGVVDWFRKNGAKSWPQNDHGKGPTQAAWMERGYKYGMPGACNTWKASTSNVA